MMPHQMKPESLMMSYGYKPELSEGAIKCPIFQTSTFVFKNAEEGKAFFEVAYGLREPEANEEPGLIYSRLNNPDLEILENRLALWEKAEDCAVFESGMSAISTTLFEFLSPGDVLLYSNPLYGGTVHFVQHVLTKFGVEVIGFRADATPDELRQLIESKNVADRLAMIYVETPANPTNALTDLVSCRSIADAYSTADKHVLLVVDNTYLGPLWQQPLSLGADVVLYSATKYIGGHSDVIAGACLGSLPLVKRIKTLRTFLGNMAGPWTGWLLMRSLETLKLRMEQQARNATEIARFLDRHPRIEKVYFLGLLKPEDGRDYRIYQQQCQSSGAMVSFAIRGGEAEAFRFLNSLKLIKLAVSLGSTESLAQHPASMTHAGVPPAERKSIGITENLIRLSVGVENVVDIIWDIEQALEKVGCTRTQVSSPMPQGIAIKTTQ